MARASFGDDETIDDSDSESMERRVKAEMPSAASGSLSFK